MKKKGQLDLSNRWIWVKHWAAISLNCWCALHCSTFTDSSFDNLALKQDIVHKAGDMCWQGRSRISWDAELFLGGWNGYFLATLNNFSQSCAHPKAGHLHSHLHIWLSIAWASSIEKNIFLSRQLYACLAALTLVLSLGSLLLAMFLSMEAAGEICGIFNLSSLAGRSQLWDSIWLYIYNYIYIL